MLRRITMLRAVTVATRSPFIAQVVCTTSPLIHLNRTALSENTGSRAQPSNLSKLLLGGTLFATAAADSEPAESAPKRKVQVAGKPAPAKKKAGPALSAIEAAMQPEKLYQVEKLLASRLVAGHKQYLVQWEGYSEKHCSWESISNLSNVVDQMAAFDLAKDRANVATVKKLAEDKAAREAARAAAGTSGEGSPPPTPFPSPSLSPFPPPLLMYSEGLMINVVLGLMYSEVTIY